MAGSRSGTYEDASIVTQLRDATSPDEVEPTFHSPWQARIFALAVTLCQSGVYDWASFQQRLVSEIESAELSITEAHSSSDVGTNAQQPDTRDRGAIETTYYTHWLAALERLLIEDGILDESTLTHRTQEFEEGIRDASEFVHGEHEHSHENGHDHGH